VQMTKRRIELVKPRSLEIAWNTARALPASTMLMGVGAVLAGALVLRSLTSSRHHGWHEARHNGRHDGWLDAMKDGKDELKKAARDAARQAAKQGDRLLALGGRSARERAARANA